MITQEEFDALQPGDKIRIVSEWGPGCLENPSGFMDKYLGMEMTVSHHADNWNNAVKVVEDHEEWVWFLPAIEEVLGQPITVRTESDLDSLLSGI